MTYGAEVEARREEVRQLYRRRGELATELAAHAGLSDGDPGITAVFLDLVAESLAYPYWVADAVVAEVDARLDEARAEGTETPELASEAQSTREEAGRVKARVTARLLGDDVLGTLAEKLARMD